MSKVLKCAITGTVYEAWNFRNHNCFGNKISSANIGLKSIDNIVFRCWTKPSLRHIYVD